MKKKLIAGMTSAAVIASLSAPAFAANFTDVKGTPSEKAAALLKTLGVVNGDVNGNFNPNATITRAEFAKIAVMLAGYKNAADAYGTNVAPFNTDVKAGHWAAGYIQVAKDTGLVNGYDQWNFGPADNVKYEEVIAVALRILGYNDNLPGAWPSDYVIKGTQLGVTSNTSFSIGRAATRGDVALIANAVLSQNTVTYSKDSDAFSSVGQSLISKNFGKSVLSGVLEAKDANGVLTIDGNPVPTTASTPADQGDSFYSASSDVTVVGGASVEALFGHTVNYILDADGKVAYIADATPSTKVVSGVAAADATSTSVTIGTQTYNFVGSTEFVVYKNGVVGAVADIDADNELTLILNASGQVQAVVAKQYATPLIATGTIAKTTVNKARVAGTVVGGTTDEVSLADNAQIFRNGAAASLSDIQAGDVVYYTTPVGGTTTLVEAYSKKVTGTLNGYTTGTSSTFTIGGTTYSASSVIDNNITSSDIGKQVVANLDKDGKVLTLDLVSASTSSDLSYVTKYETGISRISNNEVLPGTFDRVTLLKNGQQEVRWIARTYDAATSTSTPAVTFTEGNIYNVTLNTDGEVATAPETTLTPGTIKIDGVNAANKTVTITVTSTDKTYVVPANAVLVADTAATGAPVHTDAANISFDKLAGTQAVSFAVDSTGVNLSYLVVTNGLDAVNAKPALTGVFLDKVVEYTSATTYVTKIKLLGQSDVVVTDAIDLTGVSAGKLVTLTDATPDGKYDTAAAATGSIAVANFAKGSITNSFKDTAANKTYVFNSDTKVYVQKGSADATVGSLSDFTQLFNADASTWTTVEFTPSSTQEVAGFPVVSSILVHLN